MYVTQCVQTLQSILTSSAKNAAHVQVPLPHAQTNASAVVKHRRLLEDQLMNASLDVLWPVTLAFDKSQLSAGDKRAPWHPCLFVTANCHETSPWQDSHAAQTRAIGPCPLIRVADMLGFDETMRPGASARTEQSLGCRHRFFVIGSCIIIDSGSKNVNSSIEICQWILYVAQWSGRVFQHMRPFLLPTFVGSALAMGMQLWWLMCFPTGA